MSHPSRRSSVNNFAAIEKRGRDAKHRRDDELSSPQYEIPPQPPMSSSSQSYLESNTLKQVCTMPRLSIRCKFHIEEHFFISDHAQKKNAKRMLQLEEEKIRKESVEISVITDRDGGLRQFQRPSFIFNENLGNSPILRRHSISVA